MSLAEGMMFDCQTRNAVADSDVDAEVYDRINILLLVDEFYAGHGGTEQHILFLLKKLPRGPFRIHFAVLTRIYHGNPALFPVEPVLLRNGCRSGPVGVVQRLHQLASFITRNRIDVVHAFSPVGEIFALLATRLARRGRVLAIRRNTGYWHTRSTLWRARLVRLLGAEYVANCDAAKAFSVSNEWIPPHRLTVIRNPVQLDRLKEGLCDVTTAASLGIQNGEQIVGMVATIRPIKDHATFFRAAQFVVKRCPRTRFLVVGGHLPESMAEVKALTGTLGIERQVSWTGPVSNPFSLLPHFDVGVLSSQSEGFSNALLEYATAGVATVATDVGGTREIVQENQTGFLVPPRSPELMAERICRLLCDESLRGRFGENARRRAETCFSEEKVLRQYSELYLRLANGSRGATHEPRH
jgi:glycosyltransferase involved in cell wall biosynthesis